MSQQAAQAFEIPTRLPLVTELQNRNSTLNKDARLVNCFLEKDVVKGEYFITKRPGYVTTYSKTPGAAGGLWSYSDDNGTSNFTIIGTTFYLDNTGLGLHTSYALSATSGGTYRFLQVTPVSAATKYWVVGNGDKSYYGTSSISGPTAISDVNFPPNAGKPCCKGWAVLDGTTYIMTLTGSIYGSQNLNDPRTWDPANVIQAQDDSDGGVYLTKQLSYVVAIKQWTTQFFYDAGNAVGSPLSKVPGSTIPFGCVSSETVQEIDGLLIWVTYNRSPSPQVLVLKNLQSKIISTPEVDKLLQNVNSHCTWYSFSFKMGGHRFYGVSLVDVPDGFPNYTLVVDIDQELWYIWSDASGAYIPLVGFNALSIAFQNPTTGAVYGLSNDIYNDNGSLINVDIYTPNYDGGVDRKKVLSLMKFNGDQIPGSVLQVRHSEDDYQTWSNFRRVDMSLKRPFLDNCGTFYKRAYHIRHACNTPFRIKSVGLQQALGTI